MWSYSCTDRVTPMFEASWAHGQSRLIETCVVSKYIKVELRTQQGSVSYIFHQLPWSHWVNTIWNSEGWKGYFLWKKRGQHTKKCLPSASTEWGATSNLSSWPVARVPCQGYSTPDQRRGWVTNGVTLRDGHKHGLAYFSKDVYGCSVSSSPIAPRMVIEFDRLLQA